VGNDIPTWQTYVTSSLDEGQTWLPPRQLVEGDKGGRGCVKNKPLLLDTTIICGASTEVRTIDPPPSLGPRLCQCRFNPEPQLFPRALMGLQLA
jgi:hypothetical protein